MHWECRYPIGHAWKHGYHSSFSRHALFVQAASSAAVAQGARGLLSDVAALEEPSRRDPSKKKSRQSATTVAKRRRTFEKFGVGEQLPHDSSDDDDGLHEEQAQGL